VAAKFELFKDKAGEYRWRLRHQNGNVIADSGEGYSAKSGALNGIESVKNNITLAYIRDMSSEEQGGLKTESFAVTGAAPEPAPVQIMQSVQQQKSAYESAAVTEPIPEAGKARIVQPEPKLPLVSQSPTPKRTLGNTQGSDYTIIGVLILVAWFVILMAVALAGAR